MATLPSPTKKQYATLAPVTPILESPTSQRGSFALASKTDYADLILRRSRDIRAAVNNGFSRAPSTDFPSTTTGRQLAPTQSAPSLTFYTPSPYAFQTTQEINQSIFGSGGRESNNSTGKRFNELRPFINSGSPNGSVGSGLFSSGGGGGLSRNGSMNAQDSGDGDGFDMEEVYAERTGGGFGGRTLSFGVPSTSTIEESQESTSCTKTVTKKLKRAFESEEGLGEEEDFEMDEGGGGGDTDVEEEEEVEIPDMAVFSMPIGRVLAGRRSLGRTQSLPASAFTDSMF